MTHSKPLQTDFSALVGALETRRNKERLGYGLEDMERAVKGQLPPDCRVVYVAGTNGKGSVCVKVAGALHTLGYRVGLLISPHIYSATERIQVDGRPISEEDFVFHYGNLDISFTPTFFDTFLLVALQYFTQKGVDFVVLEAGIGARLDSMNLIPCELSILTNVGLDHQELLGDTLEDIAREKSFAIRPKGKVVCGEKAMLTPILQRVIEVGADLYRVNGHCDFEEENRQIARQALQLLVGDRSQKDPLHYSLPCRYEKWKVQGVDVILDGAHNREGIVALCKRLNLEYENVVFVVHCSTANRKEALHQELEGKWIVDLGDIEKSIKRGLDVAQKRKAALCCCGSMYYFDEIRRSLGC